MIKNIVIVVLFIFCSCVGSNGDKKNEVSDSKEIDYYKDILNQFMSGKIHFASESGGNQIKYNNGFVEVIRPFSTKEDEKLKSYRIIKENITEKSILFECKNAAEIKIQKEDDRLNLYVSNVPENEQYNGMSVIVIQDK